VIEITSKRTQIFKVQQADVSPLGSMETSWWRREYWENKNGGGQYVWYLLTV